MADRNRKETQVCDECKLPKPLAMFNKCITLASGHARICKTCQPDVSHRLRQKQFIAKYGLLAYMEWVQSRQDMVDRLIGYAQGVHEARVQEDEAKPSRRQRMDEARKQLQQYGPYDEQIKHLQPKLPLSGVAQLLGVSIKEAADIVRVSGYRTFEGVWGDGSKTIPRKRKGIASGPSRRQIELREKFGQLEPGLTPEQLAERLGLKRQRAVDWAKALGYTLPKGKRGPKGPENKERKSDDGSPIETAAVRRPEEAIPEVPPAPD